jgi:glycosyltransferase involved in cell wall biosynthesis
MIGAVRVLIAARRGGSGIRTYTDQLAAGLTARSHEVFVLDETGAVAPGAVQFPTPEHRLGPMSGWVARPSVLRHARDLDVDVVHVTHLDLAPRFKRLVVTAWDPLIGPVTRYRRARERGERPMTEAAYAVVDAVACHRAASIIAVTPDVARGCRIFRRHVEWVPPFVPDDTVRPVRPNRTGGVVMVANGVDSPRKGVQLAVDTVALVRDRRPDVRLTLIGSWTDEHAASQLPGFCDVVGHLSRSDVLDRLKDFGCAIVPSVWEEFSYSALEALAAGVPVVCAPGLGLGALSGGGLFAAARRSPTLLAQHVLQALDVDRFDFPRECLASNAVSAIEQVYAR